MCGLCAYPDTSFEFTSRERVRDCRFIHIQGKAECEMEHGGMKAIKKNDRRGTISLFFSEICFQIRSGWIPFVI